MSVFKRGFKTKWGASPFEADTVLLLLTVFMKCGRAFEAD
jgi:hypothetical protein